MYASALSMSGRMSEVEEKLQAAEAALQRVTQNQEPDAKTRNLIGHIAAIRALLAATQYQADTIIAQSQRALAYLHPENTAVRTATVWKMGIAHHLRGDRAAAGQAYAEAMANSEASGNIIIHIAAAVGLGQIQELENQLHLAAQTYRRVLQLVDEPLGPSACNAYFGLARISYQWDELDAAQAHGRQSLRLAQLIENTGQSVACEAFLARLKLARGEVDGAAVMLNEADQTARRRNFVQQIPEIASARVLFLLQQGDLETAVALAKKHELPLSQARAHLAGGEPDKALAALEPWRRRAEARDWADERLKAMVLGAAALQGQGEMEKALQLLAEALPLAEPGGFIRLFVDEGPPMARLLYAALSRKIAPAYVRRLLAAFPVTGSEAAAAAPSSSAAAAASEWVEPLSEREIEVLQLIAQGLTNREVADRLYLSLHTVKTHARNIYAKLGVKNRTEAVAKGRGLGILSTS
jgi:LuxR family maltose regulon positive regulatory protein